MRAKIYKYAKYRKSMGRMIYCFAILSFILLFTQFASADTGSLGGIKLGQTVNITQGCSGSTYANISQITLNGRLINNTEISMVKSGVSYTYPYQPGMPGYYTVLTHCDEYGLDKTAPLDFTVSASGSNGSGASLALFIIIILLVYTVTFVGFFGKHEWITILGGMAMLSLGVYMFQNGIIQYKDAITKVISLTTIGIGAMLSIFAGVSVIEENLQ